MMKFLDLEKLKERGLKNLKRQKDTGKRTAYLNVDDKAWIKRKCLESIPHSSDINGTDKMKSRSII